MDTRTYRFGNLREKLRESASEFKPKLGDGVERTEKAQNRKANQDIQKETSDYNKGVKSPGGSNRTESAMEVTNRSMGDIIYDEEPGERFKKNVKAQMAGYTGAQDEENHKDEPLGNADRNPELANHITKHAKEVEDMENALSNSGQITKFPNKDLHQGGVVESAKTSLLKFKHVQFISESHMLSHVPDEYKTEGKRFYMQDCKGNKYLVEWHSEPNVEKLLNESVVSGELNRIKELFTYNGKNTSSTNSMRVNEGRGVEDMLGRVRSLMK
jgi:hypothetical protein